MKLALNFFLAEVLFDLWFCLFVLLFLKLNFQIELIYSALNCLKLPSLKHFFFFLVCLVLRTRMKQRRCTYKLNVQGIICLYKAGTRFSLLFFLNLWPEILVWRLVILVVLAFIEKVCVSILTLFYPFFSGYMLLWWLMIVLEMFVLMRLSLCLQLILYYIS